MDTEKRGGKLAEFGRKIVNGLASFFKYIGNFFKDFGVAFAKGDIFVKLSALIMGLGHIRRGKIVYGIFVTLVEVAAAAGFIFFALPNLSKFSTLGTVKYETYFDPDLFTNVTNDYDHSFKILLYSIISIILIAVFVVFWMNNIKSCYRWQKMSEEGKRIPTFRDSLNSALNENYHRTLLALPILGIVTFTIVPLIVMIAVAFTNYDQQHMPPNNLFTWVGLDNFKSLFSDSLTITFGYSFVRILIWTLVWAFVATFTCYIGGILLALLINNKHTKGKKIWRLLFVIPMAVPQFVSLLLVRNFFADQGIVNTFCSNIGLTELLKTIGLVPSYLDYIPFLTSPGWAMFTIIIINIWVGVPYLLLIATGILMNIPADLYEAATIDGASPWQKFKTITMPYMLFVTGPYLVNSVVQNINNFNVIYLLTQGVYETSDQYMAMSHAREIDLLVTWLFRLTNEYYDYKMASVIGILVFVVCSVITLVAFNFIIKGDKETSMQ